MLSIVGIVAKCNRPTLIAFTLVKQTIRLGQCVIRWVIEELIHHIDGCNKLILESIFYVRCPVALFGYYIKFNPTVG